MALVLGLPTAAHGAIHHGRSQGLPVLAQSASTHARGRRPRQAPSRLANSSAPGVAFGLRKGLGTWISNSISRLSSRPACAPTNASGSTSRPCPHGSGSSWVASPSMCESLLRYTLPVYPGASPDAVGKSLTELRLWHSTGPGLRHVRRQGRGSERCASYRAGRPRSRLARPATATLVRPS
jgi:hypothetical protein